MPLRNEVSRQARADGYQVVLPFVGGVRDKILDVVRAHHTAGLTAEDVHAELAQVYQGVTLNCVRSRLTEAFQDGQLIVLGKRKNLAGTVRITVYSVPR